MTNNQLAENSVNQLLNSVRLARDNAERADNRVDHSFYYALTIALEELQERRKAAMDSEPVAYIDKQWTLVYYVPPMSMGLKIGDKLYRHAQQPVVQDGYVMVPKDLLSELRDWAHPEIEKYCEMWEGRRDSEFPALRKVISDAYALLVAAPQSPSSEPATVPGKWIPVSERMPEDEQEVLTINKMGHRFVSFFDKHSGLFFDRLDAPAACCIERVLVTYWMPLPAAPQEVKSES